MTVLTRSRYRKMQNAAVQDRLSSLPEDILIHILSFVETVDAVRTSILSKRWERLWVFVPNLSFTHYSYDDAEGTRFKNFVLGVLRAHDPSTNIYKFYLDYEYCPWEDTSTLIPTLMIDCLTVLFNHGVRELVILTVPEYICGAIFLSTFSCATLVSMDIKFPDSDVFLPDSVLFPMLKLLRINITDPNESFVEKLCSGCPVLEDFQLSTETKNYLLINIVSNTLKRLELDISSEYNGSEVILDAPALEDLSINDEFVMPFDISARNLLSIEKASIYLDGKDHDDDDDEGGIVHSKTAFEFLKGISKVRSLCLRSNSSLLELITPDDGGIPCFGKTTFMNLTYLELEIESFESLFIVLAKMPNLEIMKLDLQILDDVDEFPIMLWQTPHLKSIKLICANVEEEEECILQQLLMYVLYNANFLEEMAILWRGCPSKEFRESFLKRLEAARTSDKCQIKVYQ